MAHFLLEGLTLRHLCDWACWMKANQSVIDWNKFYALCKEFKYDRFIDTLNTIYYRCFNPCCDVTNLVTNSLYADKILENTLYEDSKIYNKGGKWYLENEVWMNIITSGEYEKYYED